MSCGKGVEMVGRDASECESLIGEGLIGCGAMVVGYVFNGHVEPSVKKPTFINCK